MIPAILKRRADFPKKEPVFSKAVFSQDEAGFGRSGLSKKKWIFQKRSGTDGLFCKNDPHRAAFWNIDLLKKGKG